MQTNEGNQFRQRRTNERDNFESPSTTRLRYQPLRLSSHSIGLLSLSFCRPSVSLYLSIFLDLGEKRNKDLLRVKAGGGIIIAPANLKCFFARCCCCCCCSSIIRPPPSRSSSAAAVLRERAHNPLPSSIYLTSFEWLHYRL